MKTLATPKMENVLDSIGLQHQALIGSILVGEDLGEGMFSSRRFRIISNNPHFNGLTSWGGFRELFIGFARILELLEVQRTKQGKVQVKFRCVCGRKEITITVRDFFNPENEVWS